jgi:hypothetical protein
MKTAHTWSLIGRAAAAGILLAVSGCQYQWGALAHPQIRSLAVGTFANDTRESGATASLRGKLAEVLSKEPGITLAQPEVADAVIQGKIVAVAQHPLARAKLRDEADVKHDADAYQTVLYRMQVTVEYEVRIPGYAKPFMEKSQVIGQADMGNWPDQQIQRSSTLGLALADAATQIVAAVTEAW